MFCGLIYVNMVIVLVVFVELFVYVYVLCGIDYVVVLVMGWFDVVVVVCLIIMVGGLVEVIDCV